MGPPLGARILNRAGQALLAVAFGLSLCTSQASAETVARDLRIAGTAERARLALDFDGEPQPRWMLLRGPHRLVIDLPGTKLALAPVALKSAGLVGGLRYGVVGADTSRLILTADGPFSVERLDIVKNEQGDGFRLSAELVAASEAQFEKMLALQAQTTGSTEPDSGVAAQGAEPSKRQFRVVIDAGHGGDDTGAKGGSGIDEKEITLTFAQALKEELAAHGRFDVIMTRETDMFLALDERVAIARRHEANLLVSIHADTVKQAGVHGATVYTLSDQASDPEAEALAIRENLSDELAGISAKDESQQVADILVDLTRRETHGFSLRFARTLLGEFKGKVSLIKNPHRSAGFRVLRAPDVPSVLIELGYLSNKKDEARLRDAEWRKKTIRAIGEAIESFAGSAVSAGG